MGRRKEREGEGEEKKKKMMLLGGFILCNARIRSHKTQIWFSLSKVAKTATSNNFENSSFIEMLEA